MERAPQEEFGDRCDETDKQHDQLAHANIVPISTNVTRLGTVWLYAINREFATDRCTTVTPALFNPQTDP